MIPALRVRLTAIYGGILFVFVALLLGVSYWLMSGHLHRTLPDAGADAALAQLGEQYLLALGGVTLVAVARRLGARGRELRAMQAAFDARERFVANASHELRSPLTVIRTEADVTLSDPDANVRELRAMGETVVDAVDEMDALLDGLMVLARSDHGVPRWSRSTSPASRRRGRAASARPTSASASTSSPPASAASAACWSASRPT